MSEQYKTFPIGKCDFEKDVRIEVVTGEIADAPECNSLVKNDYSRIPQIEVIMRENVTVEVNCLEFGNCPFRLKPMEGVIK